MQVSRTTKDCPVVVSRSPVGGDDRSGEGGLIVGAGFGKKEEVVEHPNNVSRTPQ